MSTETLESLIELILIICLTGGLACILVFLHAIGRRKA